MTHFEPDEPKFGDEYEEIAWLRERLAKARRGGRTLGERLDRLNLDVLDLTRMHHVIDSDGDGDWMLVWERLAELVAKGHAVEGAARLEAATTTDEARSILDELIPVQGGE